jgi:hypothetical protein
MRIHRAGATPTLVLAAALALASAPTASAAETASRSFTATGESELVVPAGVTSMQVKLVGGAGSPADNKGPLGGSGALVTGTISVTPGETLFVEVGGYFETTSPGFPVEATNGGGDYGGQFAGAGGGATDVRTCSSNPANALDPLACTSEQTLQTRLLVAGGGGGGGGNSNEPGVHGGVGGNAGSPGAGGEHNLTDEFEGGGGGGAATQSAGGEPGDYPTPHGSLAGAGQLGRGGNGGGEESGDYATAGGGGGGGGIFGGGGGGSGESEYGGFPEAGGGGGGGGSSGVPSGVGGVSSVTIATAAHSAIPEALFTWTRPAPSVAGAPASSVTADTATLAGSVNPNGSQVTDCHFLLSPAPPSGPTAPCAQQLGSGEAAVPVSAALAGLTAGTAYTAILVASSAQGSSDGAPVTFTTAAAGAPADLTPPAQLSLRNLRLAPRRFRRARRRTTWVLNGRTAKGGTRISFTLSETAKVTLHFQRAAGGVLRGRTCVAPSRAHVQGKHCTRYVPVKLPAPLSNGEPAGTDAVAFYGLAGGNLRLGPGTYRLSVSATAGNASAAAPQHPTFVLLGP